MNARIKKVKAGDDVTVMCRTIKGGYFSASHQVMFSENTKD